MNKIKVSGDLRAYFLVFIIVFFCSSPLLGRELSNLLPWGAAYGQLGGFRENVLNFPGLGPTALKVDKRGHAFILDAFNMRILELNSRLMPVSQHYYARAGQKPLFASSLAISRDGGLILGLPELGAILLMGKGKLDLINIETDLIPPIWPHSVGSDSAGNIMALDNNHGLAFFVNKENGGNFAIADDNIQPFFDSSNRPYGIRISIDNEIIIYKWDMDQGITLSFAQYKKIQPNWKIRDLSIIGIDEKNRLMVHGIRQNNGDSRHFFLIFDGSGQLIFERDESIEIAGHALHMAMGPENRVYIGEIRPSGYELRVLPIGEILK